jgi:tetratricopeptide (TPR) repeat protein
LKVFGFWYSPLIVGDDSMANQKESNSEGENLKKNPPPIIKLEINDDKKRELIRSVLLRLKKNPKSSNLWFSLGVLLSDVEIYEYANEAFDRVANLNPNHKKLWTAKAYALSRLGRGAEASECFKKSLEIFYGKLIGYNDAVELQREVIKRKIQLGMEGFDDASIEFLTANILDLDTFIRELETIEKLEGETALKLESIYLKLIELEKMTKPMWINWFNILGRRR